MAPDMDFATGVLGGFLNQRDKQQQQMIADAEGRRVAAGDAVKLLLQSGRVGDYNQILPLIDMAIGGDGGGGMLPSGAGGGGSKRRSSGSAGQVDHHSILSSVLNPILTGRAGPKAVAGDISGMMSNIHLLSDEELAANKAKLEAMAEDMKLSSAVGRARELFQAFPNLFDNDPTRALKMGLGIKDEDYTLGEGQVRFRGSQQIAAGPPKATNPANLQSKWVISTEFPNGIMADYNPDSQTRTPGSSGYSYQGKPLTNVKDAPAVSDPNRPLAPIIIQTPSGFQQVTRGPEPTSVPVKEASTGNQTPLPDTAAVRAAQVEAKQLMPLINNLKKRSESIIQRIGPAQRLDAAKRGVEAVFGNDPDFRVYQDFSNALAVSFATLMQGSRPSDADVFRAAKPMVPNPYSDTPQSAAAKWELIFDLMRTRLSPEARKELGLDEGAGAGANKFSVTVNGKVYPFNSEAELLRFKQQMGIQ